MSKIRFHHFYDPKTRHLVMTAASMDLNKEEVLVATAVVNPKDTGNKKMGRTIAEGRLRARHAGRHVKNSAVMDQETFTKWLKGDI